MHFDMTCACTCACHVLRMHHTHTVQGRCTRVGCCVSRNYAAADAESLPRQGRPYSPRNHRTSTVNRQTPRGWANGAATLATTTPNLLPYPGTLRWHSGARDGRVGATQAYLRERGPPRPYRTRVGVAHPLGAGRRPFGGNPKGVSEPRRLAARHASFTGSRSPKQVRNGCQ